jgi:plasmid stabilization system protein ParE
VATIVYSARALGLIECAFQFPHDSNPQAAVKAALVIQSAISTLAAHPLVGRRVEGEIRALIISYGHSGYIALYRFVVAMDEVRMLAIRHQREIGFRP